MAQGDVIQKDLGLVTAYGYALAGGYTGSEEQFKTDFAALMSGQYTALGNKPSINNVTLTGNKTTAEIIPLDKNTLEIQNGLLTAIGGGGADYERVDVASSFSAGFNFENGTINHVYVNRYGRITFLDIQATPAEDMYLNVGNGLYLFKVSASEKRAIPYQNCPVIGQFIYNINLYDNAALANVNYDSGIERTFYVEGVSSQLHIKANYNIQIQCAFINSYEG